MLPYLFLLGTILFTTSGQLLTKYAIPLFGPAPKSIATAFPYIFKVLTNGYFIISLSFGLLAALCWIFSLQKFQLSFAYPFMSLSFVLVIIFSNIIFKEHISFNRWLGIIAIIFGVYLISRS